jgi:uncharacterized protein with PIN domain
MRGGGANDRGDSSALIAILENEPEAEHFLSIVLEAPRRFVSAVTAYETGIVVGTRRGRESALDIIGFIQFWVLKWFRLPSPTSRCL